MIEILRWSELSGNGEGERALEQLTEIFFATTTKSTFSNHEERSQFFDRWAGQYLKESPERVYLVRASSSLNWQGYLISSLRQDLCPFPLQSYLRDYPAHLHMNCHPHFQGQGLGRALIQRLCQDLRKESVLGVHAITSLGASNVAFYRRLGFVEYQQAPWALMGLSLQPEKQQIGVVFPPEPPESPA